MPARVILEPRLDGYERPCLQIVEAAVFHQCFDRFAGFGAFLNLIEDNQRFARFLERVVIHLSEIFHKGKYTPFLEFCKITFLLARNFYSPFTDSAQNVGGRIFPWPLRSVVTGSIQGESASKIGVRFSTENRCIYDWKVVKE